MSSRVPGLLLLACLSLALLLLLPDLPNLPDVLPSAAAYSRRLRRQQDRYLVQSITSTDKRSFNSLRCKGLYKTATFAKLDVVCQDCYSLFKEPEIHAMCRSDCYTSSYFKRCLDALMLQDKEALYNELADKLG